VLLVVPYPFLRFFVPVTSMFNSRTAKSIRKFYVDQYRRAINTGANVRYLRMRCAQEQSKLSFVQNPHDIAYELFSKDPITAHRDRGRKEFVTLT